MNGNQMFNNYTLSYYPNSPIKQSPKFQSPMSFVSPKVYQSSQSPKSLTWSMNDR